MHVHRAFLYIYLPSVHAYDVKLANFTFFFFWFFGGREHKTTSAYQLYGNFGEKFPSNGTSIFLGTENRNGIELYYLLNTGKLFTFSRLEAWPW